jgi:hypothetical protein
LHREIVYWFALLPGLGINALLLMENYVTVYDQNSSLTIIMLIGFCYFKFFVHEGELGLIHALTVTAPTCILD